MKKSKRIETVGIILNTFWSPFHVYYMSFRSLGSHQSNTLNGARFGDEMKKIEPLKANHTKLKANFAAAKLAFGCEMEAFSLQNFAAHLTCLRNPPECFQIFATDTFGYFASDFLCLKPHFLLVTRQL